MSYNKLYFKLFFEIVLSYYYRITFLSRLNWLILQHTSNKYTNPSGKISTRINREHLSNMKKSIDSSINNSIFPTLTNEVINNKAFKNCIVVLPQNFLNEDSHVGKGFFAPVNGLISMLGKNYPNVEIVPVSVNSELNNENYSQLSVESLMRSKNYRNEDTFCVLFSVTYLIQNCNVKKITNYIFKNDIYCIGYLTSTNKNPLETLNAVGDLNCINLMIDYSGHSELNKINSTDIPVIHVPWIPISEVILNNASTISIAYSGLLKFNRGRWLVVTCALAKLYSIKISIRLYSWTAIKKGLQNFVSRKELLNWFSNYSLGIVILCRSPEINDGLIGSFWDVYHAGAIPLVQFEGLDYFLADYLLPYVDYLPFTSIEDLAMILKLLQETPEILIKLKSRNSLRRNSDLSKENIGIFLANTINSHK